MPTSKFDIAVVGDFRFPGGSGSSIDSQIRAQAQAGYRTALIQVHGPVLRKPHPINPLIRQCIDDGVAEFVDSATPVSAALTLAFHPQVFTYPPHRPLQVDAETTLLVTSHPFVDGYGDPFYDWAAIDANVQEVFGGGVLWAPVGPLVRAPVAGLADAPPLHSEDWLEVLPLAQWKPSRRRRVEGPPFVIGRHSRPDPLKWPDRPADAFAAYPASPDFRVEILGGGPFLKDVVGRIPENWRVFPFGAVPPGEFLQGIDFFVYFHHSRWVEAFGRTILEALASGVITILPEHFRPLFGDAAIYTIPQYAASRVRELAGDPRALQEQRKTAYARVAERFDSSAHVARIERLIGKPRARTIAPAIRKPLSGHAPRSDRHRVLFVTSNGIGMGHLSRTLAIASRCDQTIEPVVVTMSQAMRVVKNYGMLCHFIPHHGYLKWPNDKWNHFLRHELDELIAFHQAEALLFDGNVPYGGLIGALQDNPSCFGLWCRRAMWRPGGAAESNIERERFFHAVIEPGEISASYDAGLTTKYRARTRFVPPIRLLDSSELLDREEARARLGLDQHRLTALIQLGAENNNDLHDLRSMFLERLAARGDIQLAAAEWLIAESPLDLPEDVLRLKEFPLGRYFKAFDFIVSAAGYNSFHELLLNGVPAVFVPNENPTMDEQIMRAVFAENHRLGLCLRRDDVYRIDAVLDRILDPEYRDDLRRHCARLPQDNGAYEVAGFLSELVRSIRADRHPREFVASLHKR